MCEIASSLQQMYGYREWGCRRQCVDFGSEKKKCGSVFAPNSIHRMSESDVFCFHSDENDTHLHTRFVRVIQVLCYVLAVNKLRLDVGQRRKREFNIKWKL